MPPSIAATQAGKAAASAALGLTAGKGLRGVGYFEPSLATQFLPHCGTCGHKHPRAYRPPLDQDFCPACNTPLAAAGAVVQVPAALAGRRPSDLIGRACLGVGKLLTKLWRRL